jgi:tetratricopeptide (TPR) repeat protein
MRKRITLSIFILFLAFSVPSHAQFEHPVKLPNASQKAKVYQQVGVTDIAIVYHRPLVKGRQVFGKMVPYGKVWRTGANENTVIKFSTDVTINGQELKAGKYGFHAIPNSNSWTLIFSKDNTSWGSYFYNQESDALRVNVTPKTTTHHELLTYDFTEVTSNSATVNLMWDKTIVSFNVKVKTNDLAIVSLKKQINSLPFWGWTGLYNAANYTLTNNTHLEDGLIWINRSVQNNRNFTNLMLKSQILEKLNRASEAKPLVSEAFSMGTIRQINRYAYGKFQAKDNAAGIAALKHNIKNSPKNYQSYTAMAWGYTNAGNKKEATKMYKKALKMAPKDKHANIEKAMAALK